MRKKYTLSILSLIKCFSRSKKNFNTNFYSTVIISLFLSIQNVTAQDSFETNFDGWSNEIGDELEWTRNTGDTPSSDTGPSSGSSGSYYMYLEATDFNTGEKAWLQKEFSIVSRVNPKLIFSYHMYGSTMGSLNVLISKDNGATFASVFSESGNKGNTWNVKSVDLTGYDNETIIVRFESIRGNGFRSDIAIDNITVSSDKDTDNDGVSDLEDLDSDNDGILDSDEGCTVVSSSAFSLVTAESVIGDVNSGGKLVYKDLAGNTVVLEAAGTVGSNNIITNNGPNDGTIVIDITAGNIVFEIGASNSVDDQPKLKVSTFSADGVPFKISSISLGGIGNMDNSEAQDAIAIDVEGKWSNLTASGNTLGSAQITTSPVGAELIPGNSNTTQAELDGFDFTNLVSQGAVSEVIYNNADNNVQFGYNATFTPTIPVSSFHLIVDDINIDDGVGRNILAEFSTTSITVGAIFCVDTDGDGTPNYLDTDSDGDGCSDADEAYYSSLTDADSDNNGTYGSGTPTVDGTGKVSGASYNSINAYYLDGAVNTCNDNDNDGVPDSVDIDDDNDGVLDTDEDASCGITNSTLLFQDFGVAGSGVASPSTSVTFASLNPGITSAYTYESLESPYDGDDLQDDFYSVFNNIPEAASWASSGSERWQNIGDKTGGASAPTADRMLMVNAGNTLDVIYQQTLTGVGAGALIDVSFWVLNLDVDKPSNNGRGEPNLQIELWQNGVLLGTPVNTGDISRETKGDVNAWKEYKTANSLVALDNSDVTLIIRNNLSETNGNDLAIDDILVVQHCDTDNDGISNHLDTDSDNDGCPDALEAAGIFTVSQVTNSLTGGSIGGSLLNFGTTVNTKGIPTTVTAGAITGTETTGQAIVAAVTDANNKAACEADLKISKVVDKAIPKKGSTVIFTLTLKNDGAVDATGVQVKDLLPSGLTYNAASSTIPANTSYTAATGIWDLSGITIVKDQTIILKIAATVNTVGAIITNKTEVFISTQTDSDSTPNNNN